MIKYDTLLTYPDFKRLTQIIQYLSYRKYSTTVLYTVLYYYVRILSRRNLGFNVGET
jgi:hypothetical protein